MHSRKRSWRLFLLQLTLPFAGIVAGFIVLELGLRVYFNDGGPGRYYDTASAVKSMRWVPHPFTPYAGRPNATFELKNDDGSREHIVNNSYGFRAHEFPAAKNPEDYFILCFGGSTTYGYRVDSNANTWPERLEALLAARYPERNVKVFNLGVDMATSVFGVVNLALVGVHLQPDLVIHYEGYNEVAALGAGNFRPDHSHFYRDLDPRDAAAAFQLRVPAWLRSSYLVQVVTGVVDRATGANDLAVAVRMPENRSAEPMRGIEATFANYDTMHALAFGRGAEALFATFQFRDGNEPHYILYNDRMRAFFARRGYDYVDQDALIPDYDPTINVDVCHFTQKGRDMMAKNFFDHIVARRLLEDR